MDDQLEPPERKPKTGKNEEAVQAGNGAREEWKDFNPTEDLPKLKSEDEQTLRKTLTKYHIRWYHANIEQMTQILKAAGVPSKALNLIPSVVQGCLDLGVCK